MKMRSVMSHAFSMVPSAEIPRSSFDRSHGHKTAFQAGYLVPVYVDEALPGDTFNLHMTALARLATPLFPIMDNMFLDSFFFAVPMRLVWDNWERFNGAQDDPGDSVDFTIPQEVITGGLANGTLLDYMGVPPGIVGLSWSALFTRAYHLIWNEWFRDQNLQDSVVVSKADTLTTWATSPPLLRRGKRHDYFTSALPWPQKGDAVSLPLGTVAPVLRGEWNSPTTIDPTFRYPNAGTPIAAGNLKGVLTTGDVFTTPGPSIDGDKLEWSSPRLHVDLSAATAATINQLRQAFQVQRLLERDARGGTRYTEIIRAHFGVTSPDARLQRPEYLGGGSTPVNITAVAQTSYSSGGMEPSTLGALGAFGTAAVRGHGFTKSFTEHCILLGMVSVRADLTYQQGLNRMFSRETRYDFYWPALSHIGEQGILNKEIYADATANDDLVFGYQERYAEYRYKPSVISGIMRSTAAGSLDAWHLSQEFTALPLLNDEFIVDEPPIDRVIAIPSEPHFIFDSYIGLRCARPMPVFGVPGMIDHF